MERVERLHRKVDRMNLFDRHVSIEKRDV